MTVKKPPRRSPPGSRRLLLGIKAKVEVVLADKEVTECTMEDFLPEAVDVSSTSSSGAGGGSQLAEDDDDNYLQDDPYADVRDCLEDLSARDRARYTKNHHYKKQEARHEEPQLPRFIAYTAKLGYAILILCGHIRDLFARLLGKGRYLRLRTPYNSDNMQLYAPLIKSWENLYTRRLYHRIQDCFNRPMASNPGAIIHVLERVSDDGNKTMKLLGTLQDLDNEQQREVYTNAPHFLEISEKRVARECLNLGSYNYLGFGDDWHVTCKKDVVGSLEDLPVSNSSSRTEFGTTELHRELEQIVARFLGKEDSLALNMGFNTNCTTIPALVGRGDLIISDKLNHASIVTGARSSGAAIRVFRHNDTDHLEQILREAIVMGRPRTRRPWGKIMVVVEGIYSMEGDYCDLANVVRVCKKYGAYVYLDEAHSIGAMGPTGRGCSEYCGVDTADIDIMMGTFTKSFGGIGGYIAGSREVIAYLRRNCAGSVFHNSLSPVVCQQIISCFKVIMGEDGTNIGKQKIQALRDNSNYMRMRLQEMNLTVLGHFDSPIIPVMLYNYTKMPAFSRECYKRGLAVVVVGFPAVPMLTCRARFCISAGHTREQLDRALKEIDEVADQLKLKYNKSVFG